MGVYLVNASDSYLEEGSRWPGSDPHHLRLRGENTPIATADNVIAASPPPARREHHHRRDGDVARRITPACAERTRGPRELTRARSHHLRLRGENGGTGNAIPMQVASPPPARREPERGVQVLAVRRITSACAERTASQQPQRARDTHHLRLRGEKPPRVSP